MSKKSLIKPKTTATESNEQRWVGDYQTETISGDYHTFFWENLSGEKKKERRNVYLKSLEFQIFANLKDEKPALGNE